MCLPAPQSLTEGLRSVVRSGRARPAPTMASTSRSPAGTTARRSRWPRCLNRGVNSFKHFMAYKGALMIDDDDHVPDASCAVPRAGRPAAGACRERRGGRSRLQQQLLAQGITGPEGHALSRPPEVEAEAANRAIMLAKITGVPLYIVHTSCRETTDAIARARADGQRVFGEPLVAAPRRSTRASIRAPTGSSRPRG